MSYQELLQQMIGVTLVMLLLVGCGAPAATPVSEAPAVTSTPIPSAATPTPEPPTATPTPEPPTPTLVEVPPNTIQGLLFDTNTGESLAGQFEVVVGWDFDKDPDGPGGVKGNLIFIGGKLQGNLVVAANGEFTLREVDYPLYVDADYMILKAEEGQSLMMAIRGGSLREAAILHNESGEPVSLQFEEGKGIYLGKVYVTP